MHRLESNILHHAKKQSIKRHTKDRGFGYKKAYNYEQEIKEQRKYKLNNNTWQRIDTEPNNYKHSINLYNDDLTIKGIGYY
jgi:hypothetical protein